MIFSIAIVAVVLSYTWVIDPIAPGWVTPIPVALILGLAIGRQIAADRVRRGGDWGVSPAAFLPALWQSAALTAAGALAMYVAGSRLGTWHRAGDAWTSLALLIPWGLGQQFALHTVFLREAQAAIGKKTGMILAALLFAALHLPNPFLSAMTFTGALAWCWIYDRHPNVMPLALSHALLTLSILCAFDGALTGHLRIGSAYLNLR